MCQKSPPNIKIGIYKNLLSYKITHKIATPQIKDKLLFM